MARQASQMKQTRPRHSQAYKDEALALAERVGISKAAEHLGLHASQLYGWCRLRWAVQNPRKLLLRQLQTLAIKSNKVIKNNIAMKANNERSK